MKRQRRFSGPRKPKAPVAWFAFGTDEPGVALASYVPSAVHLLTANGINTHGLIATAKQSSLNMQPEIHGPERVRVERVRGSIDIMADAIDGVVSMGIIVAKEVAAGGTYDLQDPQLANDAARSWLWLHHCFLRTGMVGGPNGQRLSIDVKSRRVLRPDEALLLMVSISGAGTSFQVRYMAALRTLYSRTV